MRSYTADESVDCGHIFGMWHFLSKKISISSDQIILKRNLFLINKNMTMKG